MLWARFIPLAKNPPKGAIKELKIANSTAWM